MRGVVRDEKSAITMAIMRVLRDGDCNGDCDGVLVMVLVNSLMV